MVRLIIKEETFSYSKRHLFDLLDYLIDNFNWKYILKNELLDKDFIDKCLEKYNELPSHLLLITGSSQICNFNLPKDTKISYIIDDLHTGGNIRRGRIKARDKTYKIFATYGYCFNQFYHNIDINKVIWFPHSARYNIPFNNSPINKILVSGRINKNQYPNRFKIYKLSKKNNFIEYKKPDLNGYRANNENDKETKIYGEKYYNLLNKYLICFTCDASKSRPYIVAKHFEIMATGSLLLSCNPNTKKHFESLNFIDMEDYISCDDKNMEEKIEWLQDKNNLEEINRIRFNGYKKVLENHMWVNRAKILNKILK